MSRGRASAQLAVVGLVGALVATALAGRAGLATTATITDPTPGCPLTSTLTARPAPPSGLVAVEIYGAKLKAVKPPASVFSSLIFGAPVKGVDLLAGWNTIETAPNTYDWTQLDCMFSQADKQGTFVVLTLVPGFDTPSWLMQPTAANPGGTSTGGPAADFDFAYPGSTDPGPRALPLPWSSVYQSEWAGFLAQVADRYADNPAFRMIEVGGPTSVSTEMSLPDSTSGDSAVPGGNDVAEWIKLGYTSTLDEGAWKTLLADYSSLFPYQYLALSLYQGLPIGPKGHEDASQAVATPLAIIAAARKAYPASISIQADGLGSTSGTNPTNGGIFPYVQSSCSSTVTGFQTHGPGVEIGPLLTNLERGVGAGVDFIEVYAFGDVLNADGTALDPDDTSALDQVAKELPARSACAPLKLAASAPVYSSGITSVKLTATVAPPTVPADPIGIFQGQTRLIESCTSTTTETTCTASVAPRSATTYTADVAASGIVPYSAHAILSTKLQVTGVVQGSGKPHCKGGSTCS